MIRDLDTFSSCCSAAAVEEAHGGLLNTDGKKLVRPSRNQIKAAVQEAYDKLWHAGHMQLGQPEAGRESARAIEAKYGAEALDFCDDCVLRLEGRLGGLRWVIFGAPINNFDT